MREKPPDQIVTVEHDSETDTYRAEFDSAEIEPSMAVVEVVVSVSDAGPLQLDPLYEVVDPELIDQFCTRTTRDSQAGDRMISFPYHDYSVTVESRGVIEVEPLPVDEV